MIEQEHVGEDAMPGSGNVMEWDVHWWQIFS
jgi:hypothetical protein